MAFRIEPADPGQDFLGDGLADDRVPVDEDRAEFGVVDRAGFLRLHEDVEPPEHAQQPGQQRLVGAQFRVFLGDDVAARRELDAFAPDDLEFLAGIVVQPLGAFDLPQRERYDRALHELVAEPDHGLPHVGDFDAAADGSRIRELQNTRGKGRVRADDADHLVDIDVVLLVGLLNADYRVREHRQFEVTFAQIMGELLDEIGGGDNRFCRHVQCSQRVFLHSLLSGRRRQRLRLGYVIGGATDMGPDSRDGAIVCR